LPINRAKVLVLGITFKENCPDIRNSKAIDVVRELQSFGTEVDIYDPHAVNEEVQHEYGLSLIDSLKKKYHAVVLAVSHKEFASISWQAIKDHDTVVYDIKGFLDRSLVTARL
jgi:UDP-N-acetyl-D-galactosamine dehydrogenase